MLSVDVLDELATAVQAAESDLLDLLADDEVRQEDDITSRLSQGIRLFATQVDDVRITMNVIDGVGRGAAESTVGADIIGAVSIDVDGATVRKGFLAQAKMAGSDGLFFRPTGVNGTGGLDYSHAISRGPSAAPAPVAGIFSGTVEVTRPRGRLPKQCRKMLGITPDSFVFVYDSAQIAVCSATAVVAHSNATQGTRHPLGTKTLSDFFINLADCFIGDLDLGSASQAAVVDQARQLRARTALYMSISDAPTP
ncbi:MAG: hypothetical protein ACJ72L_20770 [Marmoricola sp.]